MDKLRFAVFGCGFWARYQIAGWMETQAVELVAVYNRTRAKAAKIAAEFGVPGVYDDPVALLENEKLDFVDIITDVGTHATLTKLAASRQLPVICQKPMSYDLASAQDMLQACQQAKVPLLIHENFRWQSGIRRVKELLDTGAIGRPFKGSVRFCSAFPVFENQPFLAELDQFILTDVGSHVLDVCRMLFGEARSLYCSTQRINPHIKGEDVANVWMEMGEGVHCYAEMSYASILEHEVFPQTLILVEGEKGSISLGKDYRITSSTRKGTHTENAAPILYPWVDPEYPVVHSSIVACNQNLLQALQGRGEAETTGADNLETLKLVFAAYESAKSKQVIHF